MNKKKFALLFTALFALIIISVLVIVFSGSLEVSSENAEGTYDDEIKILNDNYPSDIIVYGEDVGFDENLNFRTITELSSASLTSDPKYKYTFLVINDREGKLNITDDEFQLCKELCDEQNLNFFYIGEQYLSHLKDFGFYDSLYADNLCGIGYVISPFGHTTLQGVWTTTEEEIYPDNPELLGQILAYAFVDNVIRMMN